MPLVRLSQLTLTVTLTLPLHRRWLINLNPSQGSGLRRAISSAQRKKNQNLVGEAETKTKCSEVQALPPKRQQQCPVYSRGGPEQLADNAPCSAPTSHSDPHLMPTLAPRRAEYQASKQRNQSSAAADGGTPRWSMGDYWALEMVVMRSRVELFVGVKTQGHCKLWRCSARPSFPTKTFFYISIQNFRVNNILFSLNRGPNYSRRHSDSSDSDDNDYGESPR
jgi:hypothetical protein